MLWLILLFIAILIAGTLLRFRFLAARRHRDANWNNLRLRQQLINQQLASFREKAKHPASDTPSAPPP